MALTKAHNRMIKGSYVNVEDFGVVGDGVTDDTAGLKAAIVAARDSGQRKLMLGNSTYITSEQLDVSQIDLCGQGVFASIIKAASGFTDASILYVGSLSQDHIYENFQIDGNRTNNAASSSVGLLIEGNVLHDRFSTIKISECRGACIWIKADGAGATRPSVNTFMDIRLIDNDNIGLYATAGRGNAFYQCNFEQLGLEGIKTAAPDVTDPPQLFSFHECWIEQVGQSAASDGVKVEGAFNFAFYRCVITAYGQNPATTGHGFNILDSYFVTLDGNAVGRNRSGTSTASSAKFRFQGGARHKLIDGESTTGLTDISDFLSGYAVISPFVPITSNVQHIFFGNNASIASNLNRYVQAGTGVLSATQTDVRMKCVGRMRIIGLQAETSVLPSGSETYTVTLLKNGSTTGLSVVLNDANSATASDYDTEIQYEDGDNFSVQVSTSASATAIPAGGLHVSIGAMQY